jgi:hypothetical protein
MSKYTLSITNEKLWKFYNENQHISFEAINLIFHEIISNLVENMSATMQTTINGEILSTVHKQEQQMNSIKDKILSITENVSQIKQDTTTIQTQCSYLPDLKSQLQTIQHNVSELKSDITNNVSAKLMDFKNDYISSIKTIFTENLNNDKSDIIEMIEKNNSIFIDRTRLLLNDTITKDINEHNKHISHLVENNNNLLIDKTKLLLGETSDKYVNQCNLTLQHFQTSISEELNNLVKHDDDNAVKQFIASFDNKFSTMFQTVQTPIYAFLTASEDRIQSNILAIKDNTLSNQSKNATTMDELSSYLKKFSNSSYKGALGEAELETVLTQMFPSAEIINSSSTKACGDFMMKRDGKPNIMLENKVYENNVKYEEVDKFIRDVGELRCHAVFLSQSSGITRKKNYQVDIHKGCILVYIHNVRYSPDKIQMAIDMIDQLSERIQELDSEEEHENIISKSVLDEINQDYIEFTKQKDEIILNAKDFQKKLLGQLENLRLNSLSKYLSNKYANSQKTGYTCEHCGVYHAQTRKSLSAHVRACKKQHGGISVETDA